MAKHRRPRQSGQLRGADPDAVALDLDNEAPARAVATDGADKLGLDAEAGEPARRVGRRSTLADADGAGDVRPGLDGPLRGKDDVEDEVAEDEHPGLLQRGHVRMVSVQGSPLVRSPR